MADVASLVIRTASSELAQATARLREFRQEARQTEVSSGQLGNVVTGTFRSFAAGLVGVTTITGAIVGLANVYRRAVSEAAEFEVQHATLEAVLRATGQASGKTASQIEDLSESISRSTLATQDSVVEAAAQLLTFRSIAGETFDRTMRAAQDLAAVGFGSVSSAAVQLGKALEDPQQGLSALRRVGVSFTQAQRDLIESLVQSGRQFEAQQVILKAVEQQVGGAGAAQAGGLTGAIHRLSEAWENFLENIGNTGPVRAASDAITEWLDNINSRLNPSLKQAREHLAELQRQQEASTFLGVNIAGPEQGILIRQAEEEVRRLTQLERAKEVQAQLATDAAARARDEAKAEKEAGDAKDTNAKRIATLREQFKGEEADRAAATRAAQREAEQRRSSIETMQIEASQQVRLAAAWKQGAAAAREVELQIEQENAVRQLGLATKSKEADAVRFAIAQETEARRQTELTTAALENQERVRLARTEKLLAGPVGRAEIRPGDIQRQPQEERQQVEALAPAYQVATEAAIGHFSTVDEAGVAVGRGLTDVTTQVLLYGESWQSVAQGVLRSLAEVLIQIGITTAAVAGLRTIMGAPGGFSGALNTVLGIPFAAGVAPAAGVAAGATGGATAFTQVGAGSVSAISASGAAQGGLVGAMLGPEASASAAASATGPAAGAGSSMGMVGMFLGAGAAGALIGLLTSSVTGGSQTGGLAGGLLGGVAGFAIGGPLGAGIGAAAGGILGGQLFGQHGFDVRVPGSGGGDTVPFFAMVQPGERVTATPPGRSGPGRVKIVYSPTIDARGADAGAVMRLIEHERQARAEFERRITNRFSRDPSFRGAARVA